MKCKKCGNDLTQEMIDVNLCWTCGEIIDEVIANQEIIEEDNILKNNDNIKNKLIEDINMDICPNCKSKLNIDEKASGKCFSCGATFESSLPKDNKKFNYQTTNNTVAKAIKICGITIIILGTILSFIVAGGSGQKHESSLVQFLLPESISIISGLVFIGFSEIIQLLEDIKNKLK